MTTARSLTDVHEVLVVQGPLWNLDTLSRWCDEAGSSFTRTLVIVTGSIASSLLRRCLGASWPSEGVS